MSTINSIVNSKPIISVLTKVTNFMQNRVPFSDQNPFLKGPFAPLLEEYLETDLKVIGKIPENLNGLLLRSGPNPIDVKNPGIHSWFMGDGMAHGLRLQQGKALWYKNRFVGTHKVNDLLKRSRISGQPRGPVDMVNTSIINFGGKIWNLVEGGPFPVSMDYELNSVSYGLFNSKDNFGFAPHPRLDSQTGELHAICYDALVRSEIYYQVIDTDGQVKKRTIIPVQHGPMMHDCNMTSSKMIIFDLPITFSPTNILSGSGFPYRWNHKHPPRVGLIPKNGDAKDIHWFKADSCFVFHSCNAFDLPNGDVIVDVAVHDKTTYDFIQGPSEKHIIRFERWLLQYETGIVKRTTISSIAQDFPRFDERYAGKPYRYAYTITVGKEDGIADVLNVEENYLLRHDLHTGEMLKHSYGEGYVTGEVVFIPKSTNSAEGEGWILSYIHAIDDKPSKVVILDAQKLGEEPEAVIELPVRVPIGFHTSWVPLS